MKIIIELWGHKNKTIASRMYSLKDARLADLSEIVDEMARPLVDKAIKKAVKENTKSSKVLLDGEGCDDCRRPLLACKCD